MGSWARHCHLFPIRTRQRSLLGNVQDFNAWMSDSAHLSHRYWSICFHLSLSPSIRSFGCCLERFNVERVVLCAYGSNLRTWNESIWNAVHARCEFWKFTVFCVPQQVHRRRTEKSASHWQFQWKWSHRSIEVIFWIFALTLARAHRFIHFHHKWRTPVQTMTGIGHDTNRTNEIKCALCARALHALPIVTAILTKRDKNGGKQKREW